MLRTPLLAMALLALGCSGGGSSSSSPGTPSAPAFLTPPASQTALVGSAATFSAACTGAELTYLWQDTTGATLATQAAYTTPAVALADDGRTFTVTVANSGGTIRAQASLHVVSAGTPPVVLVEPLDNTVEQGGWACFDVEARGEPTPTVQWLLDGNAVAGATGTLFTFSPPDLSLDGSTVQAVLSNAAGSATSRLATLHVSCATAPVFVGQPASVTSFPGALVSFCASTFTASTVAWIVDGTPCQPGSTTFSLGGTATLCSVTDTGSTGTSSTLSFPAPAAAGTYAIQAVATGGGVTLASQGVTLTVTPPSVNAPALSFQGVLLDQGIQLADGSVPLVAGRPGLLRVAGAASAFNLMTPSVRVSVTAPGQAPVVYAVAAPGPGVPVAPDLAALPSQTWDVMLPGALVQPGTQVAITLDPGGQDVACPVWTIPCTPVPPVAIQFIPLVLSGGTPTLDASYVQSALQEITRLLPLGTVTGTVGAPFTPSVCDLATVANVNQALLDLESKRIADGDLQTYYQGVWQEGLDCLYAGLAFIGSPASMANRSSLVLSGQFVTHAHEFGHNLGLQHAPCGNVTDPDPDFPYSGGLIGLGQPVDITGPGLLYVDPQNPAYHDVMSYCGAFWISDYNYTKVLQSFAGAATGGGAQPPAACLLVSGFRHGQGWELRPAFSVTSSPTPDAPSGARIDLLDGDRVVASRRVSLSDAEGTEMPVFVAAIPVPGPGITGIRFTHRGRSTLLAGLAGQGMAPALTLMSAGVAHLSWDHAAHPAAMVRDEATGKVVAILGAQAQDLPVTPGHTYQVDLSLNLGSVVHRHLVPR